jgi:hypothetical protein
MYVCGASSQLRNYFSAFLFFVLETFFSEKLASQHFIT